MLGILGERGRSFDWINFVFCDWKGESGRYIIVPGRRIWFITCRIFSFIDNLSNLLKSASSIVRYSSNYFIGWTLVSKKKGGPVLSFSNNLSSTAKKREETQRNTLSRLGKRQRERFPLFNPWQLLRGPFWSPRPRFTSYRTGSSRSFFELFHSPGRQREKKRESWTWCKYGIGLRKVQRAI